MESITLQVGGSIISSGDALGQVQFAASAESDGGASRYIVGRIYGEAEGAFNASSNPASIIFATSAADNLPASGKIKISHEGHILPLLDNAYDLGSPDLRFRDLYVTSEVTSPSGNFDYIFFDTTIGDEDLVQGQMNWNSEAGTVELGLTDDLKIQIGQTVLFRVKNSTGSSLSKGQAVYASGVLGGGQIIQAAPFIADESIDEVRFIGLMTDDLANGEDGYVNHFGHIKNADLRTSNTALNPNGETWAVGDILFVDDGAAGGLTKNPPQNDIYVALVLEDGQNGELFVRITDPGHITDLHDVNLSGLVDNNLMVWNSGSKYWEPTSSMTFDGTTLHTDTDGITAIFGRNNSQTVGGKVRIYVDDADTAGSVQAIKAFNAKTTGTNFGINATANGLGATKNVGLYGWAAQATTNWGLWVDAGYGIFDDRVGIGISAPSGALHVVGEAYVDNLKLDGNTLSSLDSNGNIYIAPQGNGNIAGGLGPIISGNNNVIAGGRYNTASGTYGATVGGGRSNRATNFDTTVAGGCCNSATLNTATVGGGQSNTASGLRSTISGGSSNTASSDNSFIGGGGSNLAAASFASVGGGSNNGACGNCSIIGGGASNIASNSFASIVGGFANLACGCSSSVLGGKLNCALANFSTVSGGYSSRACGACSTVGGGYNNLANGPNTLVAGGINNIAFGTSSAVLGGNSNQAYASYSASVGGIYNRACGNYSFIGGGYSNRVCLNSGAFNSIVNGQCNCIIADAGDSAFIGAGCCNVVASGNYATVVNGAFNVASGDYSAVVAGSGNVASAFGSFVGGGHDNTSSCDGSTIGGGSSNVSNGYSSTIAGGRLNCSSNIYTTVGGGWSNNANEHSATIAGGWNNTASATCSTVGGGRQNIACGQDSTVSGGYNNLAGSIRSTVGGGWCNCANGGAGYNTVGGGRSNNAGATYAVVAGGNDNTASGYASTVAGGRNNCAICQYSTVGGGDYNYSCGQYAFVGGGRDNVNKGNYSTIAGGWANNICINANRSAILGGNNNTVSGSYSAILGGQSNNDGGNAAVFILGTGITATSANTTYTQKLNVSHTIEPSGTLFNVEGSNGSLFSVVDNLSGVLMSVNNNAGLPVFEVYDDDSIVAGRFAQEDFILDTSGNIGIGTTPLTSTTKLTIQTSAIGDDPIRTYNSSGANTVQIGHLSDDNSYLALNTNTGAGSVILRTDGGNSYVLSGNFGIGTSSPSYKLHVAGAISALSNNVYAGGFSIYGDTNNKLTKSGNDFTLSAGQTTTDIHLGYYDGGTLNKVVTVDSSEDRVGILNTAPAYTLDVTGSGHFTSHLNIGGDLDASGVITTYAALRVFGSTTNTSLTNPGNLVIKSNNSSPSLTFHSNGGNRLAYLNSVYNSNTSLIVEQNYPLQLGTNNTPRLFIAAAGNVGIGTTNPQYTLDVNGTSNLGGNVIVGGNLTVNGTTISTNVDTIEIQDPIITLGLTSGNIVTDDSYDRGVAMVTNDGTAFMGWDNSADKFVMLSSGVATNGSGNYDAGIYGNLQIADLTASGATFDGNVGIGTASPSYALDVDGEIAATGLNLYDATQVEYKNIYADTNNLYLNQVHLRPSYTVGVNGQRGNTQGMGYTVNDLGFYTASNERIRITSGGNVGIGDSSPSYKLDVAGTTAITPTAATDTLILGRVAGQSNIKATTNTHMIIDSDGTAFAGINYYDAGDVILAYGGGNVGIGTATPLYKLHVEGTFRASNAASFKEEVEFLDTIAAGSLGSDTDDTVIILNGSNYLKTREIDSRVWGSSLVDGAGSANHVAFWSDANTLTYDSSQLYWDSTNNRLGIGTASPSYNLDLDQSANTNHTINISNTNTGTGSSAGFRAESDSTLSYMISHADARTVDRYGFALGGWTEIISQYSSGIMIGTDASDVPIVFGNNSTERMRIAAGGNVGIGTATPTEKLQVVQESASSTVYLDVKNSSNVISSPAGIKLTTNYLGTARSSLIYDNWTGAGMTFQASRDIATSQGGFNWVSADSTSMMVLRRASSNNWLGLNTTNPTQTMDVRYPAGGGMALLKSTDATDGLLFGDMAYSTSNDHQGMKHAAMTNANDYMMISNGTNTYISAATGGEVYINTGGNNGNSQIKLRSTEVVVNDNSSSNDFRVESNNNANMLFVDGIADRVGIGTASPATKFHVDNGTNDGEIFRLSNEEIGLIANITGGGTRTVTLSASRLDGSSYPTLKLSGQSKIIFAVNSDTIRSVMDSSGNLGIGTETPSQKLDVAGSGNFSGDVTITGHLSAATKSFYIDHPTKEGKLQYGSLESPYHGIRLTGRGKIEGGKCVVELPDYISSLVRDDENVNIQLTNYRHSKTLYVDEINIANNEFTVKCDSWFGNNGHEFFWSFTAIRKDVQELQVEC